MVSWSSRSFPVRRRSPPVTLSPPAVTTTAATLPTHVLHTNPPEGKEGASANASKIEFSLLSLLENIQFPLCTLLTLLSLPQPRFYISLWVPSALSPRLRDLLPSPATPFSSPAPNLPNCLYALFFPLISFLGSPLSVHGKFCLVTAPQCLPDNATAFLLRWHCAPHEKKTCWVLNFAGK